MREQGRRVRTGPISEHPEISPRSPLETKILTSYSRSESWDRRVPSKSLRVGRENPTVVSSTDKTDAPSKVLWTRKRLDEIFAISFNAASGGLAAVVSQVNRYGVSRQPVPWMMFPANYGTICNTLSGVR